ncbi:MAG: SemiSWEET transporter [Ginsengibacter sp.]
MDITQVIGIIAGIFTGISLLPQLFKIIREKKTEDISTWMLLILMGGLALWIVYGILITNWPIVITNAFSLLVNIIILVLRSKFKRTN